MKSYSPEPLTPEERELAQLTGHLGPQGEPSAALDARILAAAHAGLDSKPTVRRKPRWPVAMGLAASVVFAVGIAWQLRPLQQMPAVAPEAAPAAEEQSMADSAAAAPASPAPLPEVAFAEPIASEKALPVNAEAEPAPPPAREMAPPRQMATQPSSARPMPKPDESGRARGQIAGNAAVGVPPPPPAPPSPSAVMSVAPAPVAEAPVSFAPDPRDGYSESAADSAAAPAAGASAAKQEAEALSEAKAARAASSARQQESATLDRIEVSGSRLKRTDLQVPVSDDAQLPLNEWLERVRTRYGLGDAGAAKQSLLLFVKDHPGEPVPGDLEPLLEE